MLIPIAEKTLINKKIQFTNVPYMLLSPNYYDRPDQYNVLYGSEIHIKIFLNTFNDLPYYEIKIKK